MKLRARVVLAGSESYLKYAREMQVMGLVAKPKYGSKYGGQPMQEGGTTIQKGTTIPVTIPQIRRNIQRPLQRRMQRAQH